MSMQPSSRSSVVRSFRQIRATAVIAIPILSLVLMIQGCALNSYGTLAEGERPGGATTSSVRNAPRLVVDRQTYDLGDVKQNAAQTATFRLKNAGHSLLKIADVKKCCGSSANLTKTQLKPGEGCELTVEAYIGQAAGQISRKIVVESNDPLTPQVELTITGKVIQTVTWSPTQFRIVAFDQKVKCPEVLIRSLDGVPFHITGFSATGDAFRLAFDPGREATEFTLAPIVDSAKIRGLSASTGSLVIQLDHPEKRTISVPFDVTPALEAIPSHVLIFNARSNEPISRTIQLHDNEADPNASSSLAIASVATKGGSRVELRGVTAKKANCNMNLEIWPANVKGDEGFWSDQLMVKLKDGRELTVPLRVFYQSPAVSSAAGGSLNSPR